MSVGHAPKALRKLVLARPDQNEAWRGKNPTDQLTLIDRVRGAL